MKKEKLLSIILSVVMIISIFAGCNGDNSQTAPETSPEQPAGSETPAVSEPASTDPAPAVGGTVKMLVSVTGGKDEEEMQLFQKALSDATGFEVIVEKPPTDYPKVLMQKLQSGEKYDLIYLNTTEYKSLVEQGALTDITDKVATSEILTNNIDPQEWEDIKIDGKIYAGFNKKELHRVVALNKVHLEAAGIDYKTIEPTLDGYYEVFKKLKENNTDKDYHPFNAVIAETYDLQPWMASAGLKYGVVVDEADGKTYVPYASDESAPVWEWLKKLYDEGLLDSASFVDQTKDLRGKMGAASEKTSVTVDWAMWVGLHNANAIAGGVAPEAYEIVSLPGVQKPSGDYMLLKGAASLFGIPVNAENPDGALKVLEFFATQEGGELLSVGIIDNDYTIGADGKYELTETGKTHASDHGAPRPIMENFVHPVGYNPGVEEALEYVKYASIYDGTADEDNFKRVIGKWGIQMIKGDVTTQEGLEGLRNELVTLGYVEK